MKVKLGIHANFIPIDARAGCGPQKSKTLPRFRNINAPRGISLGRFLAYFQLLWAASWTVLYKNLGGFAQGISESWGKFWGAFCPEFSAPIAAKLCVGCEYVLEVQERYRPPLSPCQVWRGSDFVRRRWGGGEMFDVFCLFVCLFCSPSCF